MSRIQRRTAHARAAKVPLWARLLVGFGALIMVGSAVSAIYIKTLLDTVNDSIGSTEVAEDKFEPGADIKGPLNLLMIGADLRVKDDDGMAQADTIIILHINAALDSATMISIPRDLKVDIADCGFIFDSPCNFKINVAFPAGGPDVGDSIANLATTLTTLTGVDFDGYAAVNFEGFTEVVDTVGTVELCLPSDITVEHPKGKVFPAGCHEYNKEDCLSLVRERYAYDPDIPGYDTSWGIGDYGRQHTQQHFIKQLLKRAHETGYTTNPLKVGTLIKDIGSQLVVDLRGMVATDLAFALSGIKPDAMSNVAVPSQPWTEYHADGSKTDYVVTEPGEQEAAAQDLYAAIRDDTLDKWIADNPDWVNTEK